MTRPPRLARLLLRLTLRGELHDLVRGDLDEEFAEAQPFRSSADRLAAVRRYWRQSRTSVADAWRNERRGQHWMLQATVLTADLYSDIRYSGRRLRREPAVTLLAIASLAIGIGINAALFSVVRSAFFAPLAVEDPHRLRLAYWSGPSQEVVEYNSSSIGVGAGQPRLRSNFNSQIADAVAGSVAGSADVATFAFAGRHQMTRAKAATDVAYVTLASDNFFDVLRVRLQIGRGFSPGDERREAVAVAVISDAYWRRVFGAAPDVVGQFVYLAGVPIEIIGVTAPQYHGLAAGTSSYPDTDITVPLALQRDVVPSWSGTAGTAANNTRALWLRILLRLPSNADDIALERAASTAASAASANAAALGPAFEPTTITLRNASRGIDAVDMGSVPDFRLAFILFGLVLALACLNVSSTLLARGLARHAEFTLRRSLGATRRRLARQVLVEALLLALAGGVAGFWLAVVATPAITSVAATLSLGPRPGHAVDYPLDLQYVACSVATTLVAGLLAGAVPAIRLSGDACATPRGRSTFTTGRSGRAILVAQFACALPVVAGAGLLLRTLYGLESVPLGYEPDGLVSFRIDSRLAGATGRNPADIYDRVVERMRAVPGVTAVSVAEHLVASESSSRTQALIDGQQHRIRLTAVGPNFFTTVGTPIRRGREIDSSDRPGGVSAVVVDELAQSRLFPDSSGIGRIFTIGEQRVQVVGIVAATAGPSLRKPPEPTVYDAYAQRSVGMFPGFRGMGIRFGAPTSMTVLLRSVRATARLEPEIRAALVEVEPGLPLLDFASETGRVRGSVARERMLALTLGLFGASALLLAALGIYGAAARFVTQRTQEIGLRMALGAKPSDVARLILTHIGSVTATGLVLGAVVTVVTTRLVRQWLFGVSPLDPWTLVGTFVIGASVAVLAAVSPIRQSLRVDPLRAMRRE